MAESSVSSPAGAVERLIDRATNSTGADVDGRLLKAIKFAVRNSDAELRIAVRTLFSLMKKPHSQIRYLSVLIIDELFMRSRLFRTLFVADLVEFLALAVGFRASSPLPPPQPIASLLRKKSVEILVKWNDSFGVHYPQLRLGVGYLKNNLKFQVPNLRENATRQEQQRRERESRTQQILVSKFEDLKASFESTRQEILSTIDVIKECLEILGKGKEDFDPSLLDSDDEVEFRPSDLMSIRLETINEGEKVKETDYNVALFDALREAHKLLVTKHLTSVQEGLSVLVRVDLTDARSRDAMLKELIDLRNEIRSIIDRCRDMGCELDSGRMRMPAVEAGDDDDDIWEVGQPEYPGPISAENNVQVSNTSIERSAAPRETEISISRVSIMDPMRSKLLAEAPVVPWGPVLDCWGSKRDVLVNHRGLELENHWGRVDHDAVVPAEKIAELNFHRTVYTEERPEIRPCLAPLKIGGLCQRRDLKVCPFHGPIVPRCAEGNPIVRNNLVDDIITGESSSLQTDDANNDGTSREHQHPDSGKATLDQLARQAIQNARKRDKEDEKAQRRAKLLRIREHNKEVLRKAAVASTSYANNFEGSEGEPSQNAARVKGKKQTLASMLKTKVTAKDRIAQRLLNSRSRGSADKELSQSEDLRYREAFPNQ